MNEDFEVIWRRGDGEMPEKAKHVVNAARDEKLLRSLQLSTDTENIIRYNASKSNQSVSEYISALVQRSLQSA
jgi:hypothetical protein